LPSTIWRAWSLFKSDRRGLVSHNTFWRQLFVDLSILEALFEESLDNAQRGDIGGGEAGRLVLGGGAEHLGKAAHPAVQHIRRHLKMVGDFGKGVSGFGCAAAVGLCLGHESGR
jgi:hypothetical protein